MNDSFGYETTGEVRYIKRADAESTTLVLQQEWHQRWGNDTGPSEWRDIPVVDE